MNSISVLIPDGEQRFSLRVATCLAQIPGSSVHVLSEEQHNSIRFSRFCASFQHCQYGNNEELRLEQIAAAVSQTGAQIILPASLEGIEFVSRRQADLRQFAAVAFVPQRDVFEVTLNKELFAQTLVQHQIPHPETLSVTSDPLFLEQLARFTFPVLIKPKFGGGGAGIHKFEDQASLLDFITTHPEVNGTYILQRFIPGRDFGCSVLSDRGKILAYTMQACACSRTGFTPLPELDIIHDPAILALTTRLIAALEWSGVAHIDLRYNELTQELEVIEINPRYWGSLLGSLVAGVNFPYLAYLSALGQDFPIPTYADTAFMGGTETVRRFWLELKTGRFDFPAIQHSSLKFLLSDPIPYLLKTVMARLPRSPIWSTVN
ncbi:MAG TPA: ATP-grasp domain-containing protein [Microcoleaceae cyanobacterium]|jgi:predicted ATP-grasp superfamily ATP-dependent carboligase